MEYHYPEYRRLLLAVILDAGIRAKKIYRAVFFIPCLISALVVGFVWMKMFSNVLPALNDLLGTEFNFLLFGQKETVLAGLLIANNWQWIGYWMLIYLAGLQSVPGDLYEGGEGRRRRRHKEVFQNYDSHAGAGDHNLRGRDYHRFA